MMKCAEINELNFYGLNPVVCQGLVKTSKIFEMFRVFGHQLKKTRKIINRNISVKSDTG
ncbi:MAG: hypothetical protein PVJ45_03980 [Desulfobacterales bacterium]